MGAVAEDVRDFERAAEGRDALDAVVAGARGGFGR